MSSGVSFRDPAPREALELTASDKSCFDATLEVPDGDIGRRDNMRLWLEARKLDLRKSESRRPTRILVASARRKDSLPFFLTV